MGEDCWAIFFFVQRMQLAACAKQAGGVNGRRRDEAAAKIEDYEGLTKKSRSKGRMDAENRWWVTELLAADCEKAWIHPGWEDTMQKSHKWLEELKKKDEEEKMEEMHQQKVAQMRGKRWALAQDL